MGEIGAAHVKVADQFARRMRFSPQEVEHASPRRIRNRLKRIAVCVGSAHKTSFNEIFNYCQGPSGRWDRALLVGGVVVGMVGMVGMVGLGHRTG